MTYTALRLQPPRAFVQLSSNIWYVFWRMVSIVLTCSLHQRCWSRCRPPSGSGRKRRWQVFWQLIRLTPEFSDHTIQVQSESAQGSTGSGSAGC